MRILRHAHKATDHETPLTDIVSVGEKAHLHQRDVYVLISYIIELLIFVYKMTLILTMNIFPLTVDWLLGTKFYFW